MWNEQDHPRDDEGKFTFKNGEKGSNTKESPANILYRDSKIKAEKDRQETEYKSKLLNILGDKARPTDVLYGTTKELEQKVKEYRLQDKLKGVMTGGAANINKQETSNITGDYGFNQPTWKIWHYDTLSKEYDREVGEFLRNNTDNPKDYSNDIRHQFVSAIFARNLGEDVARRFGDINELKPADLLDPVDSKIDKINNEIGRQYAKQYPNMPRKQLLELMLKEYPQSKQIIIQKMNEKTEKQKKLEREYL